MSGGTKMTGRRARPRVAAILAALLALAVAPAFANDPIAIDASAVPLQRDDDLRVRVGGLIYRGGLHLSAADPRFGGWSDMRVSADGTRLTAISDRGGWLEAVLRYNGHGNLAGFGPARMGRLIDLAGQPMKGFQGDAEALAALPDGGWLVAFERRHRVWRYAPAEPPFSRPPRALATPGGLAELRPNGGLETLLRLSDGMLLAIAEEPAVGEDHHRAWIGDGRSWQRLGYRAGRAFMPTAAAQLPDGRIVVLERRFNMIDGPGSRLALLPRAAVVPGATVAGAELAVIEPPLLHDNFEGIDARRGPGGETLLYLLSDDNFSAMQRTLLLMFALTGE